MAIVKINKHIVPNGMNMDDISEYVQKRLNQHYCFEDIIKYDGYDSDCKDLDFVQYLDMKGFLVSSYISASTNDYTQGIFLRCNCEDDDSCNCTYNTKEINNYLYSNLTKFFDISDLVDLEEGLRRHLALKRCASGLLGIELKTSDDFSSYLLVKQKLVDKYLGIEVKDEKGE